MVDHLGKEGPERLVGKCLVLAEQHEVGSQRVAVRIAEAVGLRTRTMNMTKRNATERKEQKGDEGFKRGVRAGTRCLEVKST